jgi:uncharacterized membrane protein HdeD (DUF308 family)
MLRIISLSVFLIVSIVIGLGAFGHAHAVHNVHEAIDQFPINSAISQTLYIVWYFVSGAMLAFGVTLLWIWFRLRARDTSSLFPAFVIGALYVIFGVCAAIYRPGDPFWFVFIILGILLLGSSFTLRAIHPSVAGKDSAS